MNYPIHIWTEEEILNLDEVTFNKNELLPFEEIKQKVQNGERLDLPSLFEKEDSKTGVYFYGLVKTSKGVFLCNIIPGVGFVEANIEQDISEDNTSECNISSLILFDLMTVNPKWYQTRKEVSEDLNADREVRMLKVKNILIDPIKHSWIDA